jgi:hypothetical protein
MSWWHVGSTFGLMFAALIAAGMVAMKADIVDISRPVDGTFLYYLSRLYAPGNPA